MIRDVTLTCALAWYFMVADLQAVPVFMGPPLTRTPAEPGRVVEYAPTTRVRSEPFTEREDCEAVARATERLRPSLLVYEFEGGRRCFTAPIVERRP